MTTADCDPSEKTSELKASSIKTVFLDSSDKSKSAILFTVKCFMMTVNDLCFLFCINWCRLKTDSLSLILMVMRQDLRLSISLSDRM